MNFYIFIFYLLIICSQAKIESLDEEQENIIYLKSSINEIFASTQITQYFKNPLDSPIELSISFPIKEEISITKFSISIGNKVIMSKVLPKEKAEEKYEEALEEGNSAFISKYDEENNYIVNIGNIDSQQIVTLNSFFIQMIGSQDMSYEFTMMEKYPTFHYKELNVEKPRNKKIIARLQIETQSKITRLIAPFLDEEAKKKSEYEVTFTNDFKSANIKYVKNPDEQKNINNKPPGSEFGFPGQVNKPTFLTSFCILFRTENMNNPVLYYQVNHELNEISYSINYVYSSESLKNIPIPDEVDEDNTISYYSKYQDNSINETPGLFIFLIDQSGSMNGKSIELVKQALLLFIKSLPTGSYFQFIGFGTDYKKYNEIPVEYNEENVNNIINIISEIRANMGGTNIGSPLNDIYKDDNYSKINLSKNILILTDGQVHDRDEFVNLITRNSNKFRIHAIGIGNSFDKILIERSGKLGKGSSVFVEDVEKINIAIIETLNKCLRPYIIDIKFNFLNYQNNIKNSILITEAINKFSYQDEIINFSFILNEDNIIDINEIVESIQLEVIFKNPLNVIKEKITLDKSDNIYRIRNGDEMSKMIVGKALKYNKELTNDIKKEIELSQKYQVLSKNTAFFAEIINDKENSEKNELIKVNLNKYMENSFRPILLSSGRGGGGGRRKALYKSHRILNMEAPLLASFHATNLECNLDLSSLNLKEEKNSFEQPNIESKKEKDLLNLIMSQDVIEGSWNENEKTKIIFNIINNDKINKITKKIKKLNKGNMEIKIKYTILVIYYLNNYHSDKLNEYKLIINKAQKFLVKNGINYDEIIKDI